MDAVKFGNFEVTFKKGKGYRALERYLKDSGNKVAVDNQWVSAKIAADRFGKFEIRAPQAIDIRPPGGPDGPHSPVYETRWLFWFIPIPVKELVSKALYRLDNNGMQADMAVEAQLVKLLKRPGSPVTVTAEPHTTPL
jgi:hypothetical protein